MWQFPLLAAPGRERFAIHWLRLSTLNCYQYGNMYSTDLCYLHICIETVKVKVLPQHIVMVPRISSFLSSKMLNSLLELSNSLLYPNYFSPSQSRIAYFSLSFVRKKKTVILVGYDSPCYEKYFSHTYREFSKS